MGNKNFWDKMKGLFVEEVKTRKSLPNHESIPVNQMIKKDAQAEEPKKEITNIISDEQNTKLIKKIQRPEMIKFIEKSDIIKILNLIKNEKIKFNSDEERQKNIIKIYNNINEELYNDIEVLEALHLVFDNKMRNNPDDQIKKITNTLKQKINAYYGTEGTKEEKQQAVNNQKLSKIEKQTENNKKTYNTVDFISMLKKQEERINTSSLTEEEKQQLIEELYENFKSFIEEDREKRVK